MNASKETCRKAREAVEANIARLPRTDYGVIMEFLEAAERKLPTEEAYAKEEERRKARGSATS